MDEIKVFIADDHTIVRKGLCSLLSGEKDITVIAEKKRTCPDMIPGQNHFVVFFNNRTGKTPIQLREGVLLAFLVQLTEKGDVCFTVRSLIENSSIKKDIGFILKGGTVGPLG